jgi:hypothetical protein
MAPKSKQAEGEENSFLPPPVDLDRIPLVDKDRLIVDTKCDFDFADLQSWLREVFLDQSDEITIRATSRISRRLRSFASQLARGFS